MLDRGRTSLLQWLRVPAMPEAPWGAPESVRVFRAGRNFYKLRVLRWSVAQVLTLGGIIFWIVMFGRWERTVDEARNAAREAPAAPAVRPHTPPNAEALAPSTPADAPTTKTGRRRSRRDDLAANSPDWLFPLLRVIEFAGLIGYFAQLPLTFALLRLDYELRWYIVTDRSLRIRQGLWRVQESTMSFANLQQVAVTQGPVQRWLNLADVRVQSAGGGSGDDSSRGHGENLHTGIFHGVDNAPEIRDLILDRLRQFRATGLGDPDDAKSPAASRNSASPDLEAAVAAAKELLGEAQALRRTLS